MKQLRFVTLFAALALLLACTANAAQSINGTWELQRETGTPYIEMRLSTLEVHGGRKSVYSSHQYNAADLGLTGARIDAAASQTQFALKRAAGTFGFTGMLGNGRGGGVFTFTPDDAFVRGLDSRGLKLGNDRDLLAAATVDLTLTYVDSIRSAGYANLSFEKMLAFRALNVTPQSIADLHGLFGTMREDEVISATALGVTKAYVESVARLGFSNLTVNQIVEFKAMHIDAAYLKHLADHGLKHLTPQQVVEAKATGL